jgi:hypothetical protein
VKEKGQGRPGAPRNNLEAASPKEQGRGQEETKEYQPPPSVWDVLERKARASDEFSRGRMIRAEYDRERIEVNRLKEEIDKRGADRDKHILALLYIRRPRLSFLSEQQQIQQWRSQVEALSDEEIAECARKQKEEIEAFRKGKIPIQSFHPSAGDGELILAEYIAKKGERG